MLHTVNQVKVTILILNNFLSLLDSVLIEMLKTGTHLGFSSFWVSIINSFSNSSYYILQKCLISCFKQEDKGKYLNDDQCFFPERTCAVYFLSFCIYLKAWKQCTEKPLILWMLKEYFQILKTFWVFFDWPQNIFLNFTNHSKHACIYCSGS